jgi:hexosaminidase
VVTAQKFLAAIRSRIRRLAAALIAILLFAFGPSARAEQPRTIPAFKQWTETAGSYSFSANSEIVLDAVYSSQLADVASTFAQDLQDLTGYSIPIVVGLGSSKPGDIYLTLDAADSAIGQEGYLLSVADQIRISAQTTTGVFYGTRSILQMLRQGLEIQAGTARDWPDYPERGLMVDLGRKYFSISFLQRHIKDLAYLKLNYFHFHLSDDLGFRLESTTHPEITSPLHYSKTDIQALLALAQSYHVMIVPEIDLPAHAEALLASHPELQLPGNPDKLDLGQPASYTLVKDLLDEYLPLFPGPFWHTGGDEYLAPSDYAKYPELLSYARQLYGPNANSQDIYIGFVNWVDGIVRAQGKQMRAWNDVYGTTGNVNAPNPDIVLDMWTTSILANDALAKGHSILNCSYATLYYVLGRANSDQADPVNLYEDWAPDLQWPGNVNLPAQAPGILGGKFHVWCDSPDAQTEDELQTNLVSYLRSLAQNTWGSPKLVPTFNAFSQIVDQIGHFPAWGPDFTLTASSLNASVTPGQTATYSLKLTPLMGFNHAIILACTVNAPGTVCALSPGIVPLTGSAASEVTVSVSTTASSAVALNLPSRPGPALPHQYAWVALIVPGLFWRRRRSSVLKKGLIPLLTLVTLLSWCLVSAGCGSSGLTAKVPTIPTPPGTYTVTVQAASGSIVHQTALNLTVQ